MHERNELYIDGAWHTPLQRSFLELTDSATGEVAGRVALGDEADVNVTTVAAERAFVSYSQTAAQERIELLERILVEFRRAPRRPA